MVQLYKAESSKNKERLHQKGKEYEEKEIFLLCPSHFMNFFFLVLCKAHVAPQNKMRSKKVVAGPGGALFHKGIISALFCGYLLPFFFLLTYTDIFRRKNYQAR